MKKQVEHSHGLNKNCLRKTGYGFGEQLPRTQHIHQLEGRREKRTLRLYYRVIWQMLVLHLVHAPST